MEIVSEKATSARIWRGTVEVGFPVGVTGRPGEDDLLKHPVSLARHATSSKPRAVQFEFRTVLLVFYCLLRLQESQPTRDRVFSNQPGESRPKPQRTGDCRAG